MKARRFHHWTFKLSFAKGKPLFKKNAVLALADLAQGKPRQLLVFVHGFSGGAQSTWPDFDKLLPEQIDARNLDIVYFQYDGLYNLIGISASFFEDLLTRLILDPASLANGVLPPQHHRKPFSYERIVVAAHSTGAVVVRRALLDALQNNHAQAIADAPVRLVFYAPAHCGAYPPVLASMAMTGGHTFLAPIAGVAMYLSPLLVELHPSKSTTLRDLLKETRKALQAKGPRHLLIAHDVLRAQNERVVVDKRFCVDPHPRPLPDEHHQSVCKPNSISEKKYARLAEAIFK